VRGRVARGEVDALVEAIPLALLILDRDLRVARVSRHYCELFGAEPENLLGCSLYALGTAAWTSAPVRAIVDGALHGEAPRAVSVECDLFGRGRCSVTVHARVLARPPADPWILFVVEDASVGHEARFDDFLGQLEHQLRGPLASIANWLHLLTTNPQDSALQEQGLAAIGEALRTQTRLLDGMRSTPRSV
jgi:light-regulated signal transduction histidine kinase (bacteriophytochrome)